jgi:hypothetical protein
MRRGGGDESSAIVMLKSDLDANGEGVMTTRSIH